MTIDIRIETMVPLREVPKLKVIPQRRNGSRLNISTLYRWVHRGLKGIKLESVAVGGQRCTSLEALDRFFNCLSHCVAEQPTAVSPLPPLRRNTTQIEKQLDEYGL
jgi:hypothetical protein